MRLGIRDLRRDLPAVVRRASAGEEVVVTVGGRPMARLVPLGSSGVSLDDLVAVGAVRPPRRRDRPTPHPLDVPVDARTDRALREVR
jgi:prevent-host-death family protein